MSATDPIPAPRPPVRGADGPAGSPRSLHPVRASSKIRARHWDRMALVYVRQSSPQQVREHRESGALQYDLVRLAEDLGWPPTRVEVIDDDQGRGAESVEGRLGFQRLLAEVGLDHVGIIVGIDMSRLARSCKDWHQLVRWVTRGCIPFAGRRPLGLLGPGSTD